MSFCCLLLFSLSGPLPCLHSKTFLSLMILRPSEHLAMALLRPRMKGRTGCMQCRRRRKKCCERRPICGQCERIGLSCSFSNPTCRTTARTTLSDTDLLDHKRQSCAIALHYETVTVRIRPAAGQSRDLCALLQYYGERDSSGSLLPDVANLALQLLPMVANTTMALAAVTAILALFMPGEWIRRSQSPLRLSQQAVRHLRNALVDYPSIIALDEVLLTIWLLYLFDVGWNHLLISLSMFDTVLSFIRTPSLREHART